MSLIPTSSAGVPDLSTETLVRVSPRDAQGYVQSRGWVQLRPVGRLMVYNRTETGSLDQVLVPMDAGRPDYAERVLEVVEKLSRFERRPGGRVLVDLLNYDADVLRYRVISSRAERGTLPLTQAIELLNGAKQSLLAAAHSAIYPKRHHARLNRSDAVQLLDACQMGQTERGSFVVTISCPLHGSGLDQTEHVGDRQPFARRATSLLGRALTELNAAIEENRVNSVVDQDKPVVSANLCQAILRMKPIDETGALEFIPSWASSMPILDDCHYRPVMFSADEFTSIEEIYRQLRPVEGPTAKPWIAFVDELKGTESEHGGREGDVIFTIFVDGEVVRAKASLDATEYKMAYEAHNPTRALFVYGQLSRGPRISRLTNITEIRPALAEDINHTP
jgi:hypothetical protein